MRVIAAINTALDTQLAVRTLFDAPTVRSLSQQLGRRCQLRPTDPALRPCTATTPPRCTPRDLTLDKFIDATTLTAAPTLPGPAPRCGRSC